MNGFDLAKKGQNCSCEAFGNDMEFCSCLLTPLVRVGDDKKEDALIEARVASITAFARLWGDRTNRNNLRGC